MLRSPLQRCLQTGFRKLVMLGSVNSSEIANPSPKSKSPAATGFIDLIL
jgi:hypothetical protein